MSMLRITMAGLRAHARRMLATALAVVFGVGFVAGTLIFADTARNGFFDTFARLARNVDVSVEPPEWIEGDEPPRLTEAQITTVRALPGVAVADGRMVRRLPMLGANGRVLSNFGETGYAISTDGDPGLRAYDLRGRVPQHPGEAMLDAETAAHQRLRPGDHITVVDTESKRHEYRLVGLLDMAVSPQDGQSVVGLPSADIARLTGRGGYEEIVVSARTGVDPANLAEEIRARIGAGPTVRTGEERRQALADEATSIATEFSVVLLIFGFVSLVVAAFVIYNTFAILLAQRVRETALLRCVGATRRQIFGSVLAESAAVGLAGGACGILLGLGVSAGLLALLNGVIDAGIPARGVVVTPTPVLVGLAVGLLVTVAAALIPAVRATRTSPLAALRDLQSASVGTVRGRVVRLVFAGLLGAAGLLLTFAGTRSDGAETAPLGIVAGGVVTFLAVLVASPLYIGPLVSLVGAGPRFLFGVPARLATANARRNPGRTAATAASLMIGVSLMSLFAVVITSVRETADRELTGRYPVDYVMTPVYFGPDPSTVGIPAGYAEAVRARPEFESVTRIRVVEADAGARVAAVDPAGALATAELRTGTAIVRAGVASTGTITVTRRGRSVTLTVVGTDRLAFPGAGTADVLVAWDQLPTLGGPGTDAMVLAKAAPGVPPTASRAALDALGGAYPLVELSSLADVSNELSDAVNGLIALFGGLLGTAVLIALFGIANTLSLSVVERTRESATVRALGLTRGQLRATLLFEALVMGLVGALVGVAYGLIYGRLLVDAAFAEFGPVVVTPWSWLGIMVALAGAAGALAAVLPARRAARASVVVAMAEA